MPQLSMQDIWNLVGQIIQKQKTSSNVYSEIENLVAGKVNQDLVEQLNDKNYEQGYQDGILSLSLAYYLPEANLINRHASGLQHPLDNDREVVNTHTLYNIASISKFILMVMVTRLIQAGDLSFTSKLSAYFKLDLPEGHEIEVKDLLGHRSGLRDSNFTAIPTAASFTQLIKQKDGKAEIFGRPGEIFYYANINFLLTAMLIEKCMKRPLAACFKYLIGSSLQIEEIEVLGQDTENSNYAHGYKPNSSESFFIDGSEHYIFGATGFRASPIELVKIMRGFFDDNFINPDLRQQILSSIKDENFEVITFNHTYQWPVKMGWGLEEKNIILDNQETIKLYCHGGWQDSHAGIIAYDPEKACVYALSVSKTQGLERIHRHALQRVISARNENPVNACPLPSFGLGCVDLNSNNAEIVDYALEKGITSFDTAECYNGGESERALGLKLKGIPRDKIFISSKGGVRFTASGIELAGDAASIQASCEKSLERVNTPYFDLYYLHRVDPKIPLEESIKALSYLVKTGKIKWLGLSEVTAAQIRRAHRIHPISVVQNEYSFWSKEDDKNGVLTTCRELGIRVVGYSPLGRGFFTANKADYFTGLAETDFRKLLPRYNGENLQANLQSRVKLEEFAATKKCSLAQLVLAWELNKGIHVIPATTNKAHLDENAAALMLRLSSTDMENIEAILRDLQFAGPRYPSAAISAIYPEASTAQVVLGPKTLAAGLDFMTGLGGLFAYNSYLKVKENVAANASSLRPSCS